MVRASKKGPILKGGFNEIPGSSPAQQSLLDPAGSGFLENSQFAFLTSSFSIARFKIAISMNSQFAFLTPFLSSLNLKVGSSMNSQISFLSHGLSKREP